MAGRAVREIRLALVCYGGVSLAVYMFGVAREIQELLIASRLLEDGNAGRVPETTTRAAYVKALESAKDSGAVVPRVVVDIISGTSAGGLDGLFLAKAVAVGRSLEPLKKLWIDEADVKTLLTGIGDVGVRLTEFIGRMLRPGSAPLGGSGMVRLVSRSLQAIDDAPPEYKEPIMPQGQSLDLFVPITDGGGHNRYLTLTHGGMTIPDVSYRHVMHFHAASRNGAENQFQKSGNPALAFAARTTSSIPGGFPPVTIKGFEKAFNAFAKQDQIHFKTEPFVNDFFKDYEGWGDNPCDTWFMDGGVLDNAPFDHAVRAIEHKRAGTEVERHLVYIEPHPEPPLPDRKIHLPNWPETIIEASRIPAHQSILDGLTGLRHRNARIEQISDLTKGLKSRIKNEFTDLGLQVSPTTEYGKLCLIENALTKVAASELGNSLEGYQQLRLQAIAAHLANIITRTFKYSKESGAAVFIREVLRAWALEQGNNVSYSVEDLKDFFDAYDVPYRERRLLFLIQGLNELYTSGNGDRALIDNAKAKVYDALEALDTLPDTQECTAMGADLFGRKVLTEPDVLDPRKYAAEKAVELDSFLACLKYPGPTEDPAFWRQFSGLLNTWPDTAKDKVQGLLERFAGYPLWDAVIFPILALSNIRQATPIQIDRISPKDGPFSAEGPKLKGTGLWNFAAFLRKNWRENDYLLGRMDAAAILLKLIQPKRNSSDIAEALRAALHEERALGIMRTKSRGCVSKESLEKSIRDITKPEEQPAAQPVR